MKEILLITRNDGQCDEWFRYLKKKIPQTMMRDNCRPMAIDILTDNCHIIIRPNSENCYRGKCPNCNEIIDDTSTICDCGQKIDWSDGD